MWIAPSRHPKIRYWTVEHWKILTFTTENDWKTAIEIFEDRINYRYLEAIYTLQENDNNYYDQNSQRRFGFSMMALDCLLIETLAQFYAGIPESPKGRGKNREFYSSFLCQASFALKKDFDTLDKANLFYDTIRCGILHQAETKKSSTIWFYESSKPNLPFEPTPDGKGLKIYWSNFHQLVKDEFTTYCKCLKDDNPIGYRTSFKSKMDSICQV